MNGEGQHGSLLHDALAV